MEEDKIYALNFDVEIEFIVGPNLKVPVVPVLIAANKVIGFDFFQTCDVLKAVMFDPVPVVFESDGLYFPARSADHWKPDLSGAVASHMFCLLIKQDLDEEKRQEVISVVNHIHGNRTLVDKKELYATVQHNPLVRGQVAHAYGMPVEKIFNLGEGLSRLLGANFYTKAPQLRKIRKKQPINPKGSFETQPINEKDSVTSTKPHEEALDGNSDGKFRINSDLEKRWNTFASMHTDVLTVEDILASCSNKTKARKRLYDLMNQTDDLMSIWEKISKGLHNRAAERGCPPAPAPDGTEYISSPLGSRY